MGTGHAVGITGTLRSAPHGVHGMGGLGKSVLAAALARHDEIRARFVDGIYWLTLGQTPQVASLQTQLGKASGLSTSDATFDNLSDGKHELAAYLADKSVLLVLDDVWDVEHASWLEVVGASGRLLMTTRNLDVLTWCGATVHSLDVLPMAQARALLAGWTNVAVAALPSDASEVADECGRLPLALAMVGALVRMRAATWPSVLRWLKNARLTKIKGKVPAYPYRNVYQAIEVSVRALEEDDALRLAYAGACYKDLSVFPEDELIPRDALCVLWGRHGLDADDVDELAGVLSTRALASVRGLAEDPERWTLTLHDLQRAYVRQCTDDLLGLHNAFIDAYVQSCKNGMAYGPCAPSGDDAVEHAYYFVRLPYHLVEAGRGDELRTLLTSYHWLARKLHVSSVAELCPVTPSLLPPGTALLRTFAGHSSWVLSVALSGDGTRALSGSKDKTLKLWDTQTGAALLTFDGHSSWVQSVALSLDGTRALSGSQDRTLKLWDTQTGACLLTFEGHSDAVMAVALSADATLALSGSQDTTLGLWNTQSYMGWIQAVAMSADGKRAMAASDGRSVVVWNTPNGLLLRSFHHIHQVNTVALDANREHALMSLANQWLELWDTRSKNPIRIFAERNASPGDEWRWQARAVQHR